VIVLATARASAGQLLKQIGFREGEDFRIAPLGAIEAHWPGPAAPPPPVASPPGASALAASPADVIAIARANEMPGHVTTELSVAPADRPERQLHVTVTTEVKGDIVRGSCSNLFGLPLAEFTWLLRDPLFDHRVSWRLADPVPPDDPPPPALPPVEPVLLLASASPRRLALVREIVDERRILALASDHEEHREPGETPEQRVRRLAREKAEIVTALEYPRSVRAILGADTEVVIDGESLGKPVSADDARRMLRLLAGRSHRVITGIAVLAPHGETVVDSVSTEVTFREMSDAEVDGYAASGEPMGKAGAYAIQGRGGMFVSRIDGSYTNVVGLPVERVAELLRTVGGIGG
jgi:septum formation protein